MIMYHCPKCGAILDPGERCDCKELTRGEKKLEEKGFILTYTCHTKKGCLWTYEKRFDLGVKLCFKKHEGERPFVDMESEGNLSFDMKALQAIYWRLSELM